MSPRGQPMLYVKLNKALYSLLYSALLFYKKLVNELEDRGFEWNQNDPCVANMMVNGFQQTVTWHVDDLKISHNDAAVNTQTIKELTKIYGPGITMFYNPGISSEARILKHHNLFHMERLLGKPRYSLILEHSYLLQFDCPVNVRQRSDL